MTDVQHDWQHMLIETRSKIWHGTPRKHRTLRMERGKSAFDTLTGHLQQFHGVRVQRPSVHYDELARLHEACHGPAEDATDG